MSLLSKAGFSSGLRCKVCQKSIRGMLQNELICFDCWNARKLKRPQRHNHKIQLPRPKKWE